MKIKAAAVQMNCSRDVGENIAHAEKLVRKAAADGANVILLPELFERQYFCQERRYDYYAFAKSVTENDAVLHFSKVCAELNVVIPVSFYEISLLVKPTPKPIQHMSIFGIKDMSATGMKQTPFYAFAFD